MLQGEIIRKKMCVCQPVSVCLCDGDAWWDTEGKSCRTRRIAHDLW